MSNFATLFQQYLQVAENEILKTFPANQQPKGLYEPITYTLSAGGKRFRAVLVMSACEFLGGDYQTAIPAALACEIFHNFTLIHDDVMDNAPLRRGIPTVYQKWDIPTAILSGDLMFAKAYQLLEQMPEGIQPRLFKVFSSTAIGLCEGQQMDVDFEKLENVSLDEYIQMIRLKTAILIAASLKMGALAANASIEDANKIYDFGIQLGIAFQIKDDWLDVFGESAKVGKQVAGDVYSGKKAAVYIKAMEFANDNQKQIIQKYYNQNKRTEADVDALINIFKEIGADTEVLNISNEYFQKSLQILSEIDGNEEIRTFLIQMAGFLINREH